MRGVQADRAKIADKAAKVFRQGVSTTAPGEKEKCFGLVSKLLQKHNLHLSDLDPSFPRRLDLVLLRQKIGLPGGGAAAGAASSGVGADAARREREAAQRAAEQRARETAAREQRERDEQARKRQEEQAARDREQRARQEQQERARQAQQQRAREEQERARKQAASRDPEVVLWMHLEAIERRQAFDGDLFRASLLAVKSTSAYSRLLAELRAHDLSSDGSRLGDTRLVELLDQLLLRPGSTISCAFRPQTMFDDLRAACMTRYRQAAAAKKQGDEARQRKEAEEQREQEEQARKQRERDDWWAQERQRQQRAERLQSREPEEVLFGHFDADTRKRLLGGPMFSRGIYRALEGTSAYARLLAELSQLDRSAKGVRLGDTALVAWLRPNLARQGSTITTKRASLTVFDDLLAACRFEYLQHVAPLREKARQRAAEEAKRQAEADRQARARQASYAHEEGTRFSRSFDELQEARLYLKVAQSRLGARGGVRSYSKGTQYFVDMTTSAEVQAGIDLSFRTALHDLQVAALSLRTEAARVRDEALRRAHEHYELQCERAFQTVVERYHP